MLTFESIDRGRREELLPPLFRILYGNMNAIAPTGEGYEKDFEEWYGCVAPALDKPNRDIIIIREDGELIGFFQYYINETTFMMEEIQLVPEACGRGIFEALYAYLKTVVPPDTPFVEAFAHRLNLKSQGILRHLGLTRTGEGNNCIHFKGDAAQLFHVLGESRKEVPEFTVL